MNSKLQQAIDYAKKHHGINVEVVYRTLEELHEIGTERGAWGNQDDGKGNPLKDRFVVLIQDDIDEIEQMITFSHELGHIIDLVKGYNHDLELWNSFDLPGVTIMREQTAWIYSVDVLKQTGFSNWSHFINTAAYSIGSYYLNTWYLWTRLLKRKRFGDPIPKWVFIKELKSKIEGNDRQ